MTTRFNEKLYILTSATFFGFITLFHLLRLVAPWSIQIGNATFPMWGSWLALIIGIAMVAWALFLISHREININHFRDELTKKRWPRWNRNIPEI